MRMIAKPQYEVKVVLASDRYWQTKSIYANACKIGCFNKINDLIRDLIIGT